MAGRAPLEGSGVLIDLVPRAAAQDFRTAPGRDLGELRALHELVEAFPRVPLAQDKVAAGRRHVFVQPRLDVPPYRLEVLDDGEEPLGEFLFLPWDHVVMHADGRHSGGSARGRAGAKMRSAKQTA